MRRNNVSALVGIARRASTRRPVSAPAASATARWAAASRRVRRAYRSSKPRTGSAKVRRGHTVRRQ
jgi:hypothetical protein